MRVIPHRIIRAGAPLHAFCSRAFRFESGPLSQSGPGQQHDTEENPAQTRPAEGDPYSGKFPGALEGEGILGGPALPNSLRNMVRSIRPPTRGKPRPAGGGGAEIGKPTSSGVCGFSVASEGLTPDLDRGPPSGNVV
jgi:hypothetical protein